MHTEYTWKKGLFQSTYRIFTGGKLVGSLTEKPLSQSAHGELSGRKYAFNTTGFFIQKTDVVDEVNNESIGKITYNTLKTTADILVGGKLFHWKNENWRHSAWSLTDADTHLKFRGSLNGGEIAMEEESPLLLLTGLFVANYYWQSLVAIFMVLFLIIVVIN